MSNNIRLIINSSPRSGQAWLEFLITNSLNFNPRTDNNILIRTHLPLMLYAKFDDIFQTIILRNPLDIIPSIVTKTMGGFGSNIVSGVSMPHEANHLPDLKTLILDQIEIYHNYTQGIIKNINTIIPFTFEQVTQDIEFIMTTLLKITNCNGTIHKNEDINNLIEIARNRIVQHNKGEIGFNNPVPIERKPDVYYEAKKIVNNLIEIKQSIDIYEKAKSMIYEKQNKI